MLRLFSLPKHIVISLCIVRLTVVSVVFRLFVWLREWRNQARVLKLTPGLTRCISDCLAEILCVGYAFTKPLLLHVA